jgi:hypothetical protein
MGSSVVVVEDNGEMEGGKTPDLGARFLAMVERQSE